MMEVVNNFFATVYERRNLVPEKGIDGVTKLVKKSKEGDDEDSNQGDEVDNGQMVKWIVKHRIRRFPQKLCQQTSVPYLFSPNFELQIDIDFSKAQFIIRHTKNDQIYMRIPSDLISTETESHRGEQVKLICSRISWHT